MVYGSVLYRAKGKMRVSSFGTSVPECQGERLRRNEPPGEAAAESHTCHCWGSRGLECRFQLGPRKSCPLRIHERGNSWWVTEGDERRMKGLKGNSPLWGCQKYTDQGHVYKGDNPGIRVWNPDTPLMINLDCLLGCEASERFIEHSSGCVYKDISVRIA